MGRLKGDATLDDILELPADASEKDRKKLLQDVAGGGFAAPGQSDLALNDFKKTGRYVALVLHSSGEHTGCAGRARAGHRTRTKA